MSDELHEHDVASVMRSLSRPLAAAISALLACGVCTHAHAQERFCAEIETDELYSQLIAEGAQLAKQGEYADAIARFEQARDICSYDPIVSFYIGRTNELMGECDTAIAMYKQAEVQRAQSYVKTALTAELIQERLEGALRVCHTVARYEIACADKEVTIQLGDKAGLPCPISGESDAGSLVLVASREGYLPHSVDVALVAGKENKISVPRLVPEGPKTGMLAFTCAGGVIDAQLTGPDRSERIACNDRYELDPGTYAVESEVVERRAWIEITPGREVELRFTRPSSPTTNGAFFYAGWSLVGTGTALTVGGVTMLGVARYMVANLSTDLSQREAATIQEDAELLDVLGWTGLGVGLGMVAGGTVMLLLDESETSDERPPSDREGEIEPVVGLGHIGLRVTW